MHEIRKNDEEEIKLVEAKFKIPTGLKVLFILWFLLGGVFSLAVGILSLILDSGGGFFFTAGFTQTIILLIIFLPWFSGIKKSQCVITNKRIYGVTSIVFVKKRFSYRLDEVDNVEIISTLGLHGLALNFTQGHGPQGPVQYNRGTATLNGAGTFRINYIVNAEELYEKLSELITSVKNDKDLMVDIEMSKVEAENRKAAAFEKMAENASGNTSSKSGGQSYIEELKGLKDLLDAGIISEAEFEEKKRQLLK